MADQTEREYYDRRYGALESERSEFIPHYKEISEYIQPRRGRFLSTDRNRGNKRHQKIINSRATMDLRIATSGMLAGVASPARPWFMVGSPDPGLNEYGPAKVWLSVVRQLLLDILDQGNFYNMAPVKIQELLLFATGAMNQEDDFEDVARFYTHTAGSYLFTHNSRFAVDTMYRGFEMTPHQMADKFGLDKLSTVAKNAMDRSTSTGNRDSWIPIRHACEPNPDFKQGSIHPERKRWRSVYWEPGNPDKNVFLSKKGYTQFPFMVTRWDLTGEDIYGTNCPGMTVLGDVKQLQLMERRKAQAIDKIVNPPLKGPPSLRNTPVTSLPGGVNILQEDGSEGGLKPVYQIQPRLGEITADMQKVEARISEGFFADLFLQLSHIEGVQPRNVMELAERKEEKLLMLGPVLERLHGEWLALVIDRLFAQCVAADILPEPPPELQGKPLKITFISALAQAQRAVASQGIERLTAFIGGLMEIKEDAIDKLNVDQVIDEYADAIGVSPTLIVADDIVSRVRKERQQQQMMQQRIEQAAMATSAAQQASNAKLGDDNVLSRAIAQAEEQSGAAAGGG